MIRGALFSLGAVRVRALISLFPAFSLRARKVVEPAVPRSLFCEGALVIPVAERDCSSRDRVTCDEDSCAGTRASPDDTTWPCCGTSVINLLVDGDNEEN